MSKSKLRNTLLAATMVAGGLIMGTAPAYATPGTAFTGTDTFLFVPGSEVPAVGANSFVSVTPTTLQWVDTLNAAAYSYLRILPPSNTPVLLTSDSGAWVDVAQIQHENNVIPLPFSFSINLTDTYQLPGATFALTGGDTLGPTILGVNFTETFNLASNAACVAASPTGVNPVGSLCDDIFAAPALDSVIGSFLFSALGEDWNLTFQILADDVIGGTSFDDAGNIIYTAENRTSNLHIQARIDQVPEPASLALLGIGLAGLGFTRRAAKKADAKKA